MCSIGPGAMTRLACPRCGVRFAIPAELFDCREQYGGRLYCPNRHPIYLRHFTDAEVAERRRASLERGNWRKATK